MSFMFRDRKETEFSYSNDMSFEKDELEDIKAYCEFLGNYILDKESELKRLYAERKAALFVLNKFGVKL